MTNMQKSFCNWLSKRKYSENDIKKTAHNFDDSKSSGNSLINSNQDQLEFYDFTNSEIENMQTVVTQSRHSSITSLVSSRNGSFSINSGEQQTSSGFRNTHSGSFGTHSSGHGSNLFIDSTGNVEVRRRMSYRPHYRNKPPMLRQNTWDETNVRKMIHAQRTQPITGHGRAVKRELSKPALKSPKMLDKKISFRKESVNNEEELANMIPGLKL